MSRPSFPLAVFGRARREACPRPRSFLRGFTLIELLTVVAVIAVLVGLGLPALGSAIDSITLSSASNAFFSTLHLARSEAIKRNSRVVLCKSADGLSCAESGGWQQGWLTFHDANNNAALDSGETVIQRAEPLDASLRLTGNLNVAKYISFAPSGAAKLLGGGFQAGTLTLCRHSAEGAVAREIILSITGRLRVNKTSVPSCA